MCGVAIHTHTILQMCIRFNFINIFSSVRTILQDNTWKKLGEDNSQRITHEREHSVPVWIVPRFIQVVIMAV